VHSEASNTLRAGQLARLCSVSTDTLRHYERVGVLPRPRRSPAGYRLYPAEAVDRVRLIRRALALGFTLAELAGILRTRDRGGIPCRKVRELATGKLAQLEDQLAAMTALRDHLSDLLAHWDQRLKATPDGARALLLEALGEPPSTTRRFQP
jgi:DNA-binding transcriptional MerR regulator